jgi:DNA helicase-2/ATP-dependent DNA helicase PcrA
MASNPACGWLVRQFTSEDPADCEACGVTPQILHATSLTAAGAWFIHLSLLTSRYPDHPARLNDLEGLVSAASMTPTLAEFVATLTLDPPASTGDLAGHPHLDEDYLVLSTVHSAKGLEWQSVHVIHVVDGASPL